MAHDPHNQRELLFEASDMDGDAVELETSQREVGWLLYVGTTDPQGAYLTATQARAMAAALVAGADLIESRSA